MITITSDHDAGLCRDDATIHTWIIPANNSSDSSGVILRLDSLL